MQQRILGIDPGIARTGMAVVEGSPGSLSLCWAECYETDANQPDSSRLFGIYSRAQKVISEWTPDSVAIEQLFFAKNQTTAMRVAQGRGAVLAAAGATSLPVAEYTPMQVKESIAGWGGAPKPQVTRMVKMVLGPDGIAGEDDLFDACAIAICHHFRSRLATMTSLHGKAAHPSPAGAAQ